MVCVTVLATREAIIKIPLTFGVYICVCYSFVVVCCVLGVVYEGHSGPSLVLVVVVVVLLVGDCLQCVTTKAQAAAAFAAEIVAIAFS